VSATWCIERTRNGRFPFRISVEQDGRLLLAVRAQSAWPAPGGQVFCLRERDFDPGEWLEPVERVRVAALNRIGPRLVVALDRPGRKRCEFLFLAKARAGGGEPYEQIFFRTETAIRAHRTSGKVELWPKGAIDVAIDARERYPWRFPGARITRRALPAGDYALTRDEAILAVVERKTLESLLGDIGAVRALHQQLAQLASQPRAALVVEAQYGDFLDASKTRSWPPSHVARVLAEIAALHPKLPLVFAGNRKLANHWTARWFAAVAADAERSLPLFVSDVRARWESPAPEGGLDERIREAVLVRLPPRFRVAELRERAPDAEAARIARVLAALRREGRLVRVGHGRAAAWERRVDSAP
jgi:hypothetical protein